MRFHVFMHPADRALIDHFAAQAAEDLRRLAGLWVDHGAASLTSALRTNPAWTFAFRTLPDAVKLFAMRACAPPDAITLNPLMPDAAVYHHVTTGGEVRTMPEIVLTFGSSTTGERCVLACTARALVLATDPAFETVIVAPSDSTLAEEMAWRFDVGVSAAVALPAWLGRFDADAVAAEDASLLRVLDAVARMLDGRLNFVAGLRAVVNERSSWGLPENDPDMQIAYAIDSQTVDPTAFFWRKQQRGGQWSWDDEMVEMNAWAREQATEACLSLIARFRIDPFS